MLSTSTINGITSRGCATPGVAARLTNRNEAAANAVVAVVMVPTTANEGTLNAGGMGKACRGHVAEGCVRLTPDGRFTF